MNNGELNQELGNIDIYLLDQILKGRVKPGTKILDAGCGEGRNLTYLMNNNFDVHGIDINPAAIRMLNFVASSKGYGDHRERFQSGDIGSMPFPDQEFDWVICGAVLHFALDQEMFFRMFSELVRVLKTGGTLFIRMASDFLPTKLQENNFTYLLTDEIMVRILDEFGLQKIEPVKTVIVEDQRCMTTLVLGLR